MSMTQENITDRWQRGVIRLREVDPATGELKSLTGAVKRDSFIDVVLYREGNKRARVLADMEHVHSFEPFDAREES